MSAYAVPGFLFPPLPSSFDAIGQSNLSIVERTSSSVEKIDTYSCRSRSPEQPLYASDLSNGIQITVHDTKIDAVQLIQSFLSSTSKGSSAPRRKPPLRRGRSNSAWNRSVASSSVDPTHSTDPNSVSKPLHQEESCMMFTLRMVWGMTESPECEGTDGSKSAMTITRTLAQIRQLYSDIVMEQEVIEDGVEAFHCHSPVPDIPLPPSNIALYGGTQDYCHIPSFTYLQEQIRSYVPVLNHWFHLLVQKVPLMRSSVFMKFIDTKTDDTSVKEQEAPLVRWSLDSWYDTPNDDLSVYTSLRPRVSGTPKVGRTARRIDSMESIDEGRGDEDDEID